jgi:hypothetical protein
LLLSLSKYQDKRIEKINQTKMKNNNLFQIPINTQVIRLMEVKKHLFSPFITNVHL